MVDFSAFVDEMIKIAEGSDVIPLVKRLPRDADQAMEAIKSRISRSDVPLLGHPSVAIPVKKLGDLESRGFKRTRLAVPLPGERIGSPTWRKGPLHAHRLGEHYLMHMDKFPPVGGPIRAIKHAITEGVPATRKRLKERAVAAIGT